MEKKRKRLVLGICGSSAAITAPAYVNKMVRDLRLDTFVIMTKAARKFLTPLSLELCSQNPVITGFWSLDAAVKDRLGPNPFVTLAKTADVVVILPATSEFIGRVAGGINSDPLSTCVLATRAPTVFFPAMNELMWDNRIVQRNVDILAKELGFLIVPPVEGIPISGDIVETGALPPVGEVLNVIENAMAKGNAENSTASPGD